MIRRRYLQSLMAGAAACGGAILAVALLGMPTAPIAALFFVAGTVGWLML